MLPRSSVRRCYRNSARHSATQGNLVQLSATQRNSDQLSVTQHNSARFSATQRDSAWLSVTQRDSAWLSATQHNSAWLNLESTILRKGSVYDDDSLKSEQLQVLQGVLSVLGHERLNPKKKTHHHIFSLFGLGAPVLWQILSSHRPPYTVPNHKDKFSHKASFLSMTWERNCPSTISQKLSETSKCSPLNRLTISSHTWIFLSAQLVW